MIDVLLLLVAFLQEGFTIAPNIELAKEDTGLYTFLVKGSTNFPDETVVDVELNAITFRTGPDGKDQEEKLWMFSESATVRNGSFQIPLGHFARTPFSLRYEVTVIMDPGNQPPAVLKSITGEENVEVKCSYGALDVKRFKEEVEAVRKGLAADFLKLDAFHRELTAAFAKRRQGGADAEWKAAKKAIFEKIDELSAENDKRMGMWLVKMETRGQIYLKGLCVRLKEQIALCNKVIGGEEKLEILQEAVRDFESIYGDYYRHLGFIGSDDHKKIAEFVGVVRESLEKMKRCAKAKVGGEEWGKTRDAIRQQVVESAFQASENAPDNVLKTMTDVSENIAKLIFLCDKSVAGDETVSGEIGVFVKTLEDEIASFEASLKESE